MKPRAACMHTRRMAREKNTFIFHWEWRGWWVDCVMRGKGGRREGEEASEFFSSNHVSCKDQSQRVRAASARVVIRMPCDCLATPVCASARWSLRVLGCVGRAQGRRVVAVAWSQGSDLVACLCAPRKGHDQCPACMSTPSTLRVVRPACVCGVVCVVCVASTGKKKGLLGCRQASEISQSSIG